MISIDYTRKLQAKLASAVTTPVASVAFYDVPSMSKQDYSDYQRSMKFIALNGTSDVDICDAPSQGTIRNIDYVNIYNADAGSVTVTVMVDDNGTDRIQVQMTLATTESAVWTPTSGWKVVT